MYQRRTLAVASIAAALGWGCEGPGDPSGEDELVAIPAALGTKCSPGPEEISIFRARNFGGECVNLPVGPRYKMTKGGFPDNGTMSYKIGSGVRATFFADPIFAPAGGYFTAQPGTQAAELGSAWRGRLSSVRIVPSSTPSCSSPPNGFVALYTERGFRGDCAVLNVRHNRCSDPARTGVYQTVMAGGLGDNEISSVRLGANVGVTLCDGHDLQGDCWDVEETTADLGEAFRNRATSARLYRLRPVRENVCVP